MRMLQRDAAWTDVAFIGLANRDGHVRGLAPAGIIEIV